MSQQKPFVIVTGSSGLIGAPVVRRLARSGPSGRIRSRRQSARGRQAFVHLEDLIDAVEHAFERRCRLDPELTLLIGEPEALTYGELQELGRVIHGRSRRPARFPSRSPGPARGSRTRRRSGASRSSSPWMVALADDDYELDISRARTTIRWEPRHSLRETLPKMIARLRKDPVVWYGANKLGPPPWLAYVTPESVSTARTA